jgi:hypothetical protein
LLLEKRQHVMRSPKFGQGWRWFRFGVHGFAISVFQPEVTSASQLQDFLFIGSANSAPDSIQWLSASIRPGISFSRNQHSQTTAVRQPASCSFPRLRRSHSTFVANFSTQNSGRVARMVANRQP